MKKLLIVFIILTLLCSCTKKVIYDDPQGNISDMTAYNNLQTDRFYDLTIDDFLDLIEEEKTFIAYFGYEECPWCNDLLPTLNEVATEKDLKIYYIDFHAQENMDNIEGLEKIKDLSADYLQQDEQGQLKLYFPTVFYVRKGKIVELHQGTVSGHDASKNELTEKQQARLKYNLEKEFDNLFKE